MAKKKTDWNVKDLEKLKSLHDIANKIGEDFESEIKKLNSRLNDRFVHVLELISKIIKKKIYSKKIYMPWKSLGWSFFEDENEEFKLSVSLYENFNGDEVPNIPLHLVIHGSDEEIVNFMNEEMRELEDERNIRSEIRNKLTDKEIEYLGLN